MVRLIAWLGDSKKRLKEFPQQVRSDIGAALFAAQCGEMAEHVKPFKGVGSGVFEIVDRYDKGRSMRSRLVRKSTCCMSFKRNPR